MTDWPIELVFPFNLILCILLRKTLKTETMNSNYNNACCLDTYNLHFLKYYVDEPRVAQIPLSLCAPN